MSPKPSTYANGRKKRATGVVYKPRNTFAATFLGNMDPGGSNPERAEERARERSRRDGAAYWRERHGDD